MSDKLKTDKAKSGRSKGKQMEAAEVIETPEIETPADTENAEIAEGEELATDDSEAPESETVEPEPWMLDDDGENEKPVKHLKAKKRLKGELEAKNDENEALRARIATLEQAPAPTQTGSIERPDELDFETKEDYHKALDDFEDRRYELRQQAKMQTQAQENMHRELSKSVDSHYDRAEKLIEEHGIKSENYKDADMRVRGAIEAIAPKAGNFVTDQLIDIMGEGSEKVMYHLGRNKAALAELQDIMRTDAKGLRAAMFLGRKFEQLTNPVKRRTQAPAPAPQAKGDTGGQTSDAIKRKYDAAHKSKDGQTAFSLKREAKKAGIDTSKW